MGTSTTPFQQSQGVTRRQRSRSNSTASSDKRSRSNSTASATGSANGARSYGTSRGRNGMYHFGVRRNTLGVDGSLTSQQARKAMRRSHSFLAQVKLPGGKHSDSLSRTTEALVRNALRDRQEKA